MPPFLKNIIKRVAGPVINESVAAALIEKAAKDPIVAELPTAMQIGYSFTGGSRRKYGGVVDFDSLRTFSTVYDVARACINHRKRQIANLEWAVVPKDAKADPEKYRRQIDIVSAFFEKPVHGQDFKMFTDKIIEDLLVLDAAVLWKDKTFGATLKELLPIDGSTIRLKVTKDGTLPEPPEGAYQQVIRGQVHAEYSTEEMYYKMMNPRTSTPYGLSPLESLVIGVDGALRSQLYNNAMLQEGTIPEGFFGVPADWKPEQIKDYQMWFDSMMSGNFNNTSRIKFMPGGKGVGYIPTKKPEDMRFLEFEKWLLVKCCAMFDVQPSSIGFVENLPQNPGETQQQFANERGLVPMATFLKAWFTQIIREDFNMPELKFEWKGLQAVDDDFELKRAESMISKGAMTINEWRIAQGMDPLEDPAADMAMVFTATGPVPLSVEDTSEEEEEPTAGEDENEAEMDDMDKWETKCLNALKRGKGVPEFESQHIDKSVQSLIRSRLAVAKSKEEVRAAFKPFKEEIMERKLIKEALRVSDKISSFKRNRHAQPRSRTRAS